MYFDLKNSFSDKCIKDMSPEYKNKIEKHLQMYRKLSEEEKKWVSGIFATMFLNKQWEKYKDRPIYYSNEDFIGEKYILKKLKILLTSPNFYMGKKPTNQVKKFYETTRGMLEDIQSYDFLDEENYRKLLTVIKNIFILIENIYLSEKIVTLNFSVFNINIIDKWINKTEIINIWRCDENDICILSPDYNKNSWNFELTYIYIVLVTAYYRINEILGSNKNTNLSSSKEQTLEEKMKEIASKWVNETQQDILIQSEKQNKKSSPMYLEDDFLDTEIDIVLTQKLDKITQKIDEIMKKRRG